MRRIVRYGLLLGLALVPGMACDDPEPRVFEVPVHAAWYVHTGAITFVGSQFEVSGSDHHSETLQHISGGLAVYGVASPESTKSIDKNLNSLQKNNVNGYGSDPSLIQVPALGLHELAETIRAHADTSISGGSYSGAIWGSVDDPRITHVSGNLETTTSMRGAGILVVEGAFNINGEFEWRGLVITLGSLAAESSGAQKSIYGAVYSGGYMNAATGNMDVWFSSGIVDRINGILTGANVQLVIQEPDAE